MIFFLLGFAVGAAGLPVWIVGAKAMGDSMAGKPVTIGTKLLLFSFFSVKIGTLAWALSATRSWRADETRLFALGLVAVYSAHVGRAALRRTD